MCRVPCVGVDGLRWIWSCSLAKSWQNSNVPAIPPSASRADKEFVYFNLLPLLSLSLSLAQNGTTCCPAAAAATLVEHGGLFYVSGHKVLC